MRLRYIMIYIDIFILKTRNFVKTLFSKRLFFHKKGLVKIKISLRLPQNWNSVFVPSLDRRHLSKNDPCENVKNYILGNVDVG